MKVNSERQGIALSSNGAMDFIRSAPPPDTTPITRDNAPARRAAILEGFAPASRRALERHRVEILDTEWGGIKCQEVLPAARNARPIAITILYFFGGGYVTGSPFEELPITAALAEQCHARIVVPYYRLAPEHPFPAALDDGFAVYRAFVREIGPAPFAVGGESAGGNLALAVLQRAQDDALRLPEALFLLSPWIDLTHGGDSIEANAARDPTLVPVALHDFAEAYAGAADPADAALSPLFGRFNARWPATIITTGTRDLLMSQSVRLARVMREAGCRADLRVWEGLWHVFEFYDTVPEAGASLKEIAAFIHDQISGP